MTTLVISLSIFSQARMPVNEIKMKGRVGKFSVHSVRVFMGYDNTLVTTFYTKVNDVTVTVKNTDGEIVSTQTMSVEEFETFKVEIDNYTPGKYIIEIESPEGSIEGEF